jgi:hypothetical protein
MAAMALWPRQALWVRGLDLVAAVILLCIAFHRD